MSWHVFERLRERLDDEVATRTGQNSAAADSKIKLAKNQAGVDYAAQAFLSDALGPNVLAKLSRYETAIANRTLRAMRELRELRADQVEQAA